MVASSLQSSSVDFLLPDGSEWVEGAGNLSQGGWAAFADEVVRLACRNHGWVRFKSLSDSDGCFED